MSSSLLAAFTVRATDAATDLSPTAMRRHKKQRRRARELTRLDQLLDAILLAPGCETDEMLLRLLDIHGQPLQKTSEPSTSCFSWNEMAPSCDPCRLECHASARMAAGTPRGDRKRETVAAFAWVIECGMLPYMTDTAGCRSSSATTRSARQKSTGGSFTIVDAGCSTGSLLLPLAHTFPQCNFVAVDLKRGSLERLRERAQAAGGNLSSRVTTCSPNGI